MLPCLQRSQATTPGCANPTVDRRAAQPVARDHGTRSFAFANSPNGHHADCLGSRSSAEAWGAGPPRRRPPKPDGIERIDCPTLFITTRDDPRADGSPRQPENTERYERAHEPKELVILDGAAHAQYIFGTDQGDRLMQEILRFLSAP
jgi:pimeloyl-ACP methyl ester carboxylesterase